MHRVTRSRAAVCLASLLVTLAACTSPPSQDTPEGRGATVRSVLWTIAKYRDRQPHDNPAVASIDRQWSDAYIHAADPESQRVAMIQLLDQLDDGHASVLPRHDGFYYLPDCIIAPIDDRLWVEWSTRQSTAGDDGSAERFVVEVHSIDGYAPNRLSALLHLLVSERSESAEIIGRRAGRAEPERFALPRRFGGEIELASVHAPPPKGSTVMHRLTGAENEIYAAMLKESPRVGLVRYAWMSRMDKADESGDAGCQHRHEPCGVAEAMIAAADAVSDCDWIIIDLQGSLGGTCAHAAAICATLLPRSVFVMPFSHLDRGLLGNLLDTHHWKWPRRSRVDDRTRFIVLIDDMTVSASEHIAGVFRILPKTEFIGLRSAGSEYSLATIDLPDGLTLNFGANPGVWRGLPTVEGRGVAPTVRIAPDERILARDGIAACLRDIHRRSLEAAMAIVDRAAGETTGE
jgi:hypothetical protein